MSTDVERFNASLPDDLVPFVQSVRIAFGDMRQAVVRFPNDYGASIIYGTGSYGLELAVVEFYDDHHLCFEMDHTTPITNDVLMDLDKDRLVGALRQIQGFPKPVGERSRVRQCLWKEEPNYPLIVRELER